MMASARTGEVFESNRCAAREASTNLLVVSANALVVSTNALVVSTKEVGGQLAAGESMTGPRIALGLRHASEVHASQPSLSNGCARDRLCVEKKDGGPLR